MSPSPTSHDFRLTAEKIGKRIELVRPLIHQAQVPLETFSLDTLPDASTPPDCRIDTGQPLQWNSYWGGQDLHFVIKSGFTIPKGWQHPALYLPLGTAGDIFTHPEALLYIDGQSVASADRYHHTIALDPDLADGKRHALMLHGWTGLTDWPPNPDDRSQLFLSPCFAVDIDSVFNQFVTLADVALDHLDQLSEDRPEHHIILNALDHAFRVLDTRAPMEEAFRASVAPALEALQSGLSSAGPMPGVTLHAIGHAHMDIAYLWPTAQIRQKNARTSSNVLRLMERHPEFVFSQTQPQLLDWLRQDFPEMFEAVRERIKQGRWELLGGMWVEPDLNMPGAESLVRQIALSRRWAQTQIGAAETPVLWLPDTFGFPACLPQLMRHAGLKWFATNKINWNQTNRMPSSTTWWEGIDGSRVLAQFLTTPRKTQHLPFPTNYKSDLTAAEVVGTWTHSTAKSAVQDLMIAYGYGDGGGGPTDDLIRKVKAHDAMPGAPRMKPNTVRGYFEALEAKAPHLPVWEGEIYLEGHRGVLTSQGWIKRANRMAEALLHDAEYLNACLALAGRPVPDLSHAWSLLCVNQFHDILTGTAITAVFDEARRDFETIERLAHGALSEAADQLAAMAPDNAALLIFDGAPLPCPRLAELPASSQPYANAATSEPLPVQTTPEGVLTELPAPDHGYAFHALCETRTPAPAPDDPVRAGVTDGAHWLENRFLKITFAPDGTIASIIDKIAGRQVLAEGEHGNQLQAFEDRPVSWDAWDIDPFFEDRCETITKLQSIEIAEAGPLRATIKLHRHWRNSTITQRISLTRRNRRIDFATEIDWQERHILLKAAFPVAIRASTATYDIQWGHIERPTHRNTSWDAARFEVAAQKWVHLGETGYGVGLLNDGKYGHDICGHVMRLSLIKSPTSPDPVSDIGTHHFTYSLLPHPGDWRDTVPAEAYALNQPLRILEVNKGDSDINREERHASALEPLVRSLSPQIVIETIKPADDGRGVIVRFYEAQRSRGTVELMVSDQVAAVERTSLLEETHEPLDLKDGHVRLHVTPFEIVTLRLLGPEQGPSPDRKRQS